MTTTIAMAMATMAVNDYGYNGDDGNGNDDDDDDDDDEDDDDDDGGANSICSPNLICVYAWSISNRSSCIQELTDSHWSGQNRLGAAKDGPAIVLDAGDARFESTADHRIPVQHGLILLSALFSFVSPIGLCAHTNL